MQLCILLCDVGHRKLLEIWNCYALYLNPGEIQYEKAGLGRDGKAPVVILSRVTWCLQNQLPFYYYYY